MATYWENSCSFGLRYVSWYKYLIVSLVFSHLGFWSGNLFLIAPFPDLCLLVPFFEDMNSVNCEPLSSKLQNSDILHDLDQKLSHLDPDKKHELKQLILEYEGTSRQRSGKGAIRKRFPLQKPRWEKTKLTIRYLYHETIVSRMGSYFPNSWPLSYLNLTKNIKTYIRRQQHKKFLNTKT